MLPTLRAGDRLLVRYGAPVTAGRLVLARFADGTLAVKRAAEPREHAHRRTRAGGCSATTPTRGVDSRHRGVVAADDLVAVVVARLWPRPRRGSGL